MEFLIATSTLFAYRWWLDATVCVASAARGVVLWSVFHLCFLIYSLVKYTARTFLSFFLRMLTYANFRRDPEMATGAKRTQNHEMTNVSESHMEVMDDIEQLKNLAKVPLVFSLLPQKRDQTHAGAARPMSSR
ncbi:hypothetical protein O5541_09000 [Escherichia coli]|nr:hypothetical protein [Escherichia coli]